MDLFPAIDLRGGKAVRLLQCDYAQETVYGDDPVALAESFAAAGAKWIHVVDLDAARTGDPINRPVVAAVAAAVRGRAKVQTGGGVRSVADAEALAAAGVARVVMGSAAIKDRTLVAAVFRIVPVAVGLDHRDGDVALHGWTQGSGLNVMDLLDCYPDAEAFIITNIARDGMLAGPDIDGLAAAAAASPIPVIASGGVSSLDDLRMLNRVPGLAGVITGKAIYENRFTVGEALETLAEPS